jgi:hypothetical protein
MVLLNEMMVDSDGGVCLRKNLHYQTYESIVSGCTCYEVISEIDENIYLGRYVIPYKNKNPYYSIQTGDTSICLSLGSTPMSDWIIDYINTLVTTGYSGHTGDTTEKRVILDNTTNEYYLISDTETENCSGDTLNRFAIVDYNTEDIWFSGSTDFYYSEQDGCDVETGIRAVKTKDINPISETFGNILIIEKCQTETPPIITTNDATGLSETTATLNGNATSDGGYTIIERGFCYSLNRTPTIDDNKVIVSGTTGIFSKNLTGLSTDIYYHFRAYARNVLGITYGDTKIFKLSI